MAKDPRDEPRVETDVNGDQFYITEDGKRIPVKTEECAEALRDLERHMKWKERFPMGMK